MSSEPSEETQQSEKKELNSSTGGTTETPSETNVVKPVNSGTTKFRLKSFRFNTDLDGSVDIDTSSDNESSSLTSSSSGAKDSSSSTTTGTAPDAHLSMPVSDVVKSDSPLLSSTPKDTTLSPEVISDLIVTAKQPAELVSSDSSKKKDEKSKGSNTLGESGSFHSSFRGKKSKDRESRLPTLLRSIKGMISLDKKESSSLSQSSITMNEQSSSTIQPPPTLPSITSSAGETITAFPSVSDSTPSTPSTVPVSTSPAPNEGVQTLNSSEISASDTSSANGIVVLAPPKPIEIDFNVLLDRPENANLKASLESFLSKFPKATKGNAELEEQTIKDLFVDLSEQMKQSVSWSSMTDVQFTNACDSMKSFVFHRLHKTLFERKEFISRDAALVKHLNKIRPLLKPSTLDLTDAQAENTSVGSAIFQLRLMDTVNTPFEKLACILSAFRVLTFVISTTGVIASADDLLPMSIYVLLHSRLEHIVSNVEFIKRFVDDREKMSESFFFFTNIDGACTFLEGLTPERINELEAEREREIEEKKRKKEEKLRQEAEEAAAAEAEKAERERQLIESMKKNIPDFHFLYSSAADLVGDREQISKLLVEYKEMAMIITRLVEGFSKIQ